MSFFKKFTDKIKAPDASLQLRLGNYSVALGESLQGTLNVSSKEDFDATEVRFEIQCVERANVIRQVYDANLKMSVPREEEQSTVLFEAKPPISGPTHLTNGEVRDFPLTVSIPQGARPSYIGVDRNVTWTIKGVIAVHGRPDRTSQTLELQVFQATGQPMTGTKEVVRTVVLIPCKYCQGLMDQTATVCPNCGAKRTL